MLNLLPLLVTALIVSCSDGGAGDRIENRSDTIMVADSSADPQSPGSQDSESDVDSDSQNDSTTDDSTDDTTDLGLNYYDEVVSPRFEELCVSCHSPPRVSATSVGPLSIYSYKKMRSLLTVGVAEDDNELIDKVRNIAAHTGGDRCGAASMNASPCKEIAAWWNIEFASGGNTEGSRSAGLFSSVDVMGQAIGWAVDRGNLTSPVSIAAFFETAADGRQPEANASANLPGTSGSFPGVHRFSFSVPEKFRDGKEHTIYVYANLQDGLHLISGSPIKYRAFTPKQAGMDYYNATVRPQLQAKCATCHPAISYNDQYAQLISPPPGSGGLATNNNLINFPTNSGVSHPGGNICGLKTGQPCNLIQNWWNLEFQ